MKKAGKIIAAIFASICIVASLITVGFAFVAKGVQENPEAFKETVEEMVADSPDNQLEQAEEDMKMATDFILNINHEWMLWQGIVGVILSIVILVTVLINVQSMPFFTPAIACVASLVGAIYCGWAIMFFMVITLIGSGLVLLANLQKAKAD